MTVTVQGYQAGVAYTLRMEDPAAQPIEGVVTYAAPRSVLAVIDSHMGEQIALSPTSAPEVVSFESTAGVLAALTEHTEVVTITGDLPEAFPTPEYGVDH